MEVGDSVADAVAEVGAPLGAPVGDCCGVGVGDGDSLPKGLMFFGKTTNSPFATPVGALSPLSSLSAAPNHFGKSARLNPFSEKKVSKLAIWRHTLSTTHH